jgi:hypothetical protein
MAAFQILLVVFALSIPVVTLIVAGKHFRVLAHSLRERQFLFAILPFLAVASLGGLFAAMGVVWFGYGVAHSQKDLSTDVVVILVTGLPFYIAAYGLWDFADYLQAKRKGL